LSALWSYTGGAVAARTDGDARGVADTGERAQGQWSTTTAVLADVLFDLSDIAAHVLESRGIWLGAIARLLVSQFASCLRLQTYLTAARRQAGGAAIATRAVIASTAMRVFENMLMLPRYVGLWRASFRFQESWKWFQIKCGIWGSEERDDKTSNE